MPGGLLARERQYRHHVLSMVCSPLTAAYRSLQRPGKGSVHDVHVWPLCFGFLTRLAASIQPLPCFQGPCDWVSECYLPSSCT